MRRISACILVIRETSVDGIEVLMQFKCRYGEWEFPGGKIDDTETVRECALRELFEETNLDGGNIKQLLYLDHGSKFGCVVFATTNWVGLATVTEPNKQSAIGWFKLDDLPTPLTKYSAMVIEAGCLRMAAGQLALPTRL